MDTLRVWTGGTDTTLPDFNSVPIGGKIGSPTSATSPQAGTPVFSNFSSHLTSWIPSIGSSQPDLAENDCFPSLGWTQRMIMFVVMLLMGVLFCGISALVIMNPRAFGKYYTIGNIFIIGSTFFLVGPKRQLLSLFDRSRFTAAVVYFGSMAATLYFAVVQQSLILTLILVIIQLGASVWYGSSYIPFAQSIIKSTASTILPI